MNVLNLVTTQSPFFNSQVQVLEKKGVNIETVSVPRSRGNRSILDYFYFYINALKYKPYKYDIIHANYGLTAPMAIAQPSRPIVLTLWGSDLMSTLQHLSSQSAKLFDNVILPSHAMSPFLSSKYTLVPFGVDINNFTPMRQDRAREKLDWDYDENIVLFPYSKNKDVKQYDLAERVVNLSNIDAEIKSISDIPHNKVSIYMNASDVLLITSERESGPMVAKEATLCNVPVVSTDVGFTSDILSDVRNSYVCTSETELRAQLEAVIESGERSDGRKHADEWSLDKMGERLLDVYKSVLEE
jgi:glycosyltransferase involved in cell wall biosynthesis